MTTFRKNQLHSFMACNPSTYIVVLASQNSTPNPKVLQTCTKTAPLRNAMWTVSNFFRGTPKPNLEDLRRMTRRIQVIVTTWMKQTPWMKMVTVTIC